MPLPSLNSLRTALRGPKRWKRWGIEAAFLLAIVGGITLWQNRDLPAGPAPALAGFRTDGSAVKVGPGGTAIAGSAANIKTASLVVFWATWCGVCKAEAGNIENVARDWPVISVAMQSGDHAEVAKYLAEKQLKVPAIADDDGDITGPWRVRGVPAHFILDPAGNIRFRVVGYATEWGLRLRLWWAQNFAA
jgi:thiol-disulfide isomerase/thioredoxin